MGGKLPSGEAAELGWGIKIKKAASINSGSSLRTQALEALILAIFIRPYGVKCSLWINSWKASLNPPPPGEGPNKV
jgi:hypothetical protein